MYGRFISTDNLQTVGTQVNPYQVTDLYIETGPSSLFNLSMDGTLRVSEDGGLTFTELGNILSELLLEGVTLSGSDWWSWLSSLDLRESLNWWDPPGFVYRSVRLPIPKTPFCLYLGDASFMLLSLDVDTVVGRLGGQAVPHYSGVSREEVNSGFSIYYGAGLTFSTGYVENTLAAVDSTENSWEFPDSLSDMRHYGNGSYMCLHSDGRTLSWSVPHSPSRYLTLESSDGAPLNQLILVENASGVKVPVALTVTEYSVYYAPVTVKPIRVFHLNSQNMVEEVAGVLPTQTLFIYSRRTPKEFYTTVGEKAATHYIIHSDENVHADTVRFYYDSEKFNLPKLPDRGTAKAYVYVG